MRSPVFSALLITALALPTALFGQGVTVQSVSDVRMSGALGMAANIAAKLGGGSMHDIATTMYVSGHRMRSESSNTGSIIDADAGRITTIDHKEKTYTSMTLAEMAAAMQQAAQSAKESSKQSAAKEKAKDPKATDDSLKFTYKVAVDRPGQHEKISGYDAERVFVTITIEGKVESEGKKDEAVGSMVFLLDEWRSKDAPQIAALQEFQRAYAQKAGREFRVQAQGIQSAMAGDPRMKGGFDAAAKELAKMSGIALRSVTHVVLVPVGLDFDRKAALGDDAAVAAKDNAAKKDEKPKSGGLRGMMGAVMAASENASKQDKQSGKEAAPPKQTTLMTVSNEVKSISRGDVAAEMFAPPAGYREIKRAQP